MKKLLEKGQRFGRLTVLEYSHREHRTFKNSRNNYYIYFYKCKCDCGNIGIYRERSLKSGNTKSCGCLNIDKIIERNMTHNLSNTRLYKIYHGIKKRCYNRNCRSYKDYGGRGIGLCKEWANNFLTFYNWAIDNGYSDNLTIERKDVNKEYSPENCTWITKEEQNLNKTTSVFYEYDGKKFLLGELAKRYNLPFTCLRKRLERGWDLEKALTTPKIR